MDRGAWWATVHGVTRVGHALVTKPRPPPPGFKGNTGTSLAFQMLRLHASATRGPGLIPGQGTKILQATHGVAKKKKKRI